jgi:predicted Rossmann-fold nucleotide-binding protein
LRILVCGGRDFDESRAVYRALDRVFAERGVATLIHGAARGADTLAERWAEDKGGIEVLAFPADWERDGKAAGPIRNQRMLDEGRPNGVVAFPGGRGTADMIARAKKAGIPVWEPCR